MDNPLKEKIAKLEEELAEACKSATDKDQELKQLRTQVERVQADTETCLAASWESERMRAELETLRRLEQLRAEHQHALYEEKERSAREQERMENWIRDLKDGFQQEKRLLESQVSKPEASRVGSGRPSRSISPVHPSLAGSLPAVDTPGTGGADVPTVTLARAGDT